MVKGGTLKGDAWGNVKMKNGMIVLLMGSADALPEEPSAKTIFVEDMTDEQLATAVELPCGLTNLGNTCYVNAAVQCICSVPELKDALKRYAGTLRASGKWLQHSILLQLLGICLIPQIKLRLVSHYSAAVSARGFSTVCREGEQGQYLQQDGNDESPATETEAIEEDCGRETESSSASAVTPSKKKTLVDQFFGVEFEMYRV